MQTTASTGKETEMKLIKYRDAGMNTYTYFWTDSNHRVVSPYFDTEQEAQEWYGDKIVPLDDPKRIKFEENRNYEWKAHK